jgi:hypothetical protein
MKIHSTILKLFHRYRWTSRVMKSWQKIMDDVITDDHTTSQVRESITMVLLIARNWKVWAGSSLQRHNVHFVKISPTIPELYAYRWTSWMMMSLHRIMGYDIITQDHPPTSQVLASITLVLLIVRNQKVQVWSSLKWHNIHTKFNENPFSRSQVIIWQNE